VQTKIQPHYDVVIVGAGPAGMSAAITLSEYGLSVAVFDEQAQPGGQIYRNGQCADKLLATVLNKEPLSRATVIRGNELIERFNKCAANYFPESLVWNVESISVIAVKRRGQVYQTACRYLLVASGAQERPVPFKGWQLPGVMGVGAAQILLKSTGSLPKIAPVLFGSGPLLYLYAVQLISAGLPPRAILDTTTRKNSIRSLRYLPEALKANTILKDGVRLLRSLRAASVPYYKDVTRLTASGASQIEGVEFTAGGKNLHIETSLLLSHHGVIPETQLLRASGVECYWNDSAQCWSPVLDEWGASSIEGLYVCGDVASINGAYSAEYDAALASFDIAFCAGVISLSERESLAVSHRKKSMRDKAIRPFLESRYRVPDSLLYPASDTMVCRCESITAVQIIESIEQGCYGPNQVKSFTRCGMGACQGRMCGPAVEALIACKTGCTRTEVGQFRARPPVRPVSLADIASLDQDR